MYMAYHIRRGWLFDVKTMGLVILMAIILMIGCLLFINYIVIRYAVLLVSIAYVVVNQKAVFQVIKEIKKFATWRTFCAFFLAVQRFLTTFAPLM